MYASEVKNHPIVAAAALRDEKQFFGQGWSHFPERFQREQEGAAYHLSVYNTPNQPQVNWQVSPIGWSATSQRQPDFSDVSIVALTVEESRQLAAEIGLPIGEWLGRAIEACRTDVTPARVARDGICIDEANFHAARSGG